MDILFFSEIKWNFVATRNHHLLRRFPENWKILYIEPMRIGETNIFVPQKEKNIYYSTLPLFQGYSRFWLIKILYKFKIIRNFSEFLVYFLIKILLYKLKFKPSIIITSNIYYANLLKKFKTNKIFFDYNDNILAFKNTPFWAKQYFDRTIKHSKIVFSCTNDLVQQVKNICKKDVFLIRNGVDINHFDYKKKYDIPLELKNINQKIIGYMGIISDWCNFDLIKKIALRFKTEKIVLIGPIAREVKKEVENFKKFDNVFFLGKKSYLSLPSYLNKFNVGLVPFKKTILTKDMNWAKIYIYAAMRIPIVSISNLNFKDYEKEIFWANTTQEFIKGIEKALNGEDNKENLVKIAKENTWNISAKKMIEILQR